MNKHIIFDLDGTLIDSKNEIEETYTKVFKKNPPTNGVNYDIISYTATLHANLERIYGQNTIEINNAKATFVNEYDNSEFEKTFLYPHVLNTIKMLHEKGITLHVATNKRLTPTLRILEIKQMSKYITCVKASDSIPNKITSKIDMVKSICTEYNLKNGYMIGDCEDDIIAGQLSDLLTVAVTYGYQKKDDLIKKKPTFVIDAFIDLLTII